MMGFYTPPHLQIFIMKNILSFSIIILVSLTIATPQAVAQDVPDMETYIQENDLKVQKDENGIAYIIDKKAGGQQVKTGDYVLVNYKGMRLDGFVFDESPAEDGFVFQVGYRQVIRGLDRGVLSLSKGEKGRLFVPSEMAYGEHGVGETIKPGMDLMYELEVVKILSDAAYDAYIIALEEKERLAYEQHIREQFLKDKKLIQEYALAHKFKTKRTRSGLSYVITEKGKGDLPKPGDQLEVEYEGFLIDNTRFEEAKKPKTHTFQLGMGRVIPGWDEGLTYFREGSEGFLLVPSSLGYGPRAIQEEGINIPADAVLVFKIKVKEVTAL